jgi:hypothetical protein
VEILISSESELRELISSLSFIRSIIIDRYMKSPQTSPAAHSRFPRECR